MNALTQITQAEPILTGDYVSSGRLLRDHYREEAIAARRFARKALRLGYRREHRQWMHDAVRAWKKFKHYQRGLA